MLSTVKPGTNVENKAQTTQPDTTLHMSKQFSNHWLKPGVEPPLKSFRNTGGQSDFTWVWKDRYYKILCRVPFHRIRLKLHEIMLKLDHNVPSSPCWGHTSFLLVQVKHDVMLWLSMHGLQKPITEWSLVWLQSILRLANGLFCSSIHGTLAQLAELLSLLISETFWGCCRLENFLILDDDLLLILNFCWYD